MSFPNQMPNPARKRRLYAPHRRRKKIGMCRDQKFGQDTPAIRFCGLRKNRLQRTTPRSPESDLAGLNSSAGLAQIWKLSRVTAE